MNLRFTSKEKRCLKGNLLSFLLICLLVVSSARGYAEQSKMLIIKKGSLMDAISDIRTTFNVVIAYNTSDINGIMVNGGRYQSNSSVEEVLSGVLKDTSIKYKKSGNSFVLLRSNIQTSPNSSSNTAQQSINVRGLVTDNRKEPLPGVSVLIKGTSRGTTTNPEGKYSISEVSHDAILVFSLIGMKKLEVPVSGQSIISVTLEDESYGLDAVVVDIGYGAVKRKDLTGAVSSVSGSTLQDIPVTSVVDAMVGRMAGVQISKTEGAPDAAVKIRVRGGGSITQDNSPLYVVDGFPVDDITQIVPADVSSIDVLKDASSTAIYGARGANGVILVTTKRGQKGKGKISLSSYYGNKEITKTLDVLSPYEYIYWQYELQNTSAMIDSYYGDFEDFELYKDMTGTNWQKEIFGKVGSSFSNNLSFRGGTEKSTYSLSLTRNDEKEIMIGSGYARTNFTVKTSHEINDWLTVDLNSRLSDYHLKGAGTTNGSRLSHAVQFRPVNGLMDFVDDGLDDGDYETSSTQILDPLKQTLDDYRRNKNRLFNFAGAATVRFSKNFSYRLDAGTQYGQNSSNRFYGVNTSNVNNYGKQPIASILKSEANTYRLANVLTFNKNNFIPDHNLTAMIGQELNYSKSQSVSNTARYFPKYIDAVSALNMMSLGIPDPTDSFDDPSVNLSSFFGRLNYDYKGKYLLTGTFRADGSSKFVPANRWGYFPSAAAAWRISNEQFMEGTRNWLDDLKLRASYGASGNNRIPDNAWQKTLTVGSGGIYLNGDGEGSTPTPYLEPGKVLSNPDLKWETTVTQNMGLDFGLFRQRLNGTIDVYKNITKDLLISATIPSSTGYANQWQNIGQTSNRGIEFTLNGDIVKSTDFSLFASFNIGFNKNRIDKLGDTKRWEQSTDWFTSNSGPSGEYLIKEGGQVGLMYGYETDGMYSFDDFNYKDGVYTLKAGVPDNSALIIAKRFWPGALKYKDQNGDNIVDAVNDKVVIGNANPKHSGGFNLSARFKGFDMSAFFNWVYGNDIYNANKLYFSMSATGYTFKNILNTMNSDNRFTYIDKSTGAVVSDPVQLAGMNKNATIWSAAMNYADLHTWAVEDGSFLRLNNLTLGYTLPKKVLNRLNLSNLRVYGTVYNLMTWTNYSGYDPEVDTRRSTPLTPGIDWNAYPRSRSFNIGLNLEF